MPIPREFFERDTVTVAKDLLGAVLYRRTAEGVCAGRIIETEAYLGPKDPAAHTYRGKTERTKALFAEKGVSYIYRVYGMYHCLNIATGDSAAPECVLLRALAPLTGESLMATRRAGAKDLCGGPGKLCMALSLDCNQNGLDLTQTESGLWLEHGTVLTPVASPRIGIDYAGEAALWPLRFTPQK